jgi:hypothetical protein
MESVAGTEEGSIGEFTIEFRCMTASPNPDRRGTSDPLYLIVPAASRKTRTAANRVGKKNAGPSLTTAETRPANFNPQKRRQKLNDPLRERNRQI